jgi:glucosamine--fructose-6-phosphate aminotransferase (isomerizing)
MVYEGALKLKEIARLHAEGYSAGEFGHGPLALAGPDTPVAVMAFSDSHNGKGSFTDLARALKDRGAPLILFAEDGPRKDPELLKTADCAILLPPAHPRLRPFAALIPLQLLACSLGRLKGLDVDRPAGLLDPLPLPPGERLRREFPDQRMPYLAMEALDS